MMAGPLCHHHVHSLSHASLIGAARHSGASLQRIHRPWATLTSRDRLLCAQGKDGTGRGAAKVQQLRDNSNFFRDGLRALGCEVLGDRDSPVMPVMLYNPGKLSAFSREVRVAAARLQDAR